MNKLSNSDLLDGDVSKNMSPNRVNSNRAERLQRTKHFAENPEQFVEEPVEEETHNFNHSEPKLETTADEKTSSAQIDKYSMPYSEPEKVEVGDNTIFGMNKKLVVGIAAAVVIIGGYFIYTKYFKKGVSAGATITPPVVAPVTTPIGK